MVDSIPWILASTDQDATKWNDPLHHAALSMSSRGRASMAATISPLSALVMTLSGRSSVSQRLTVRQKLPATSASGKTSMTMLLGYRQAAEVQIQGRSSVAMEMIIGVTQQLQMAIASSSDVQQNLDVKVKYRPTIEQETDGDPAHPTTSPRSIDGKTRVFFTPISSGLTNTTAPWLTVTGGSATEGRDDE